MIAHGASHGKIWRDTEPRRVVRNFLRPYGALFCHVQPRARARGYYLPPPVRGCDQASPQPRPLAPIAKIVVQSPPPMSSSPIHPTYPLEPKQGGGCVAAAVYAVLFVAGMTVLYAFFLEPFHNAIAAYGWTPTPCTVYYSKVETVTDKEKKNDKDGATIVGYRPEIKY